MPNFTRRLNLFKTDMQTDGDDFFDFDIDLGNNFQKIDDGVSFTKYSNSITYDEGDIVSFLVDGSLKIYMSVVSNNINHSLTDTDYWQEVPMGSGGLEICDIGISLFVDETKGKRRLLNGTILSINTQTTPFLNKLKSIINLYPSLACTEAEWQNIASSSVGGQCGKFVINDTAGTIRLPKIIMPIQGLTNLANLGEIVEAGLPNITGNFHAAWRSGATGGAFRGSTEWQGFQGSDNNSGSYYTFDASRSSALYGNSATVQPEHIQYPYFIQVATGVEDTVIIENEYQLNNPYSLLESKYSQNHIYNASWLLSNGQWNSSTTYVKVWQALQVEANSEISEGTTVTLPSGASYTKQGLSVKTSTDSSATDYDFITNNSTNQFKLPAKTNPEVSNLYLYFYVGDVIENGNLINAGRAMEQIAELKALSIIETWSQGAEGYRIWADGYCVQWGCSDNSARTTLVVNYLKEFADTNYFIAVTDRSNNNDTGGYVDQYIGVNGGAPYNFGLATTGFRASVMSNTSYKYAWKASGYLAEGEY